jgi:hypothetical protein
LPKNPKNKIQQERYVGNTSVIPARNESIGRRIADCGWPRAKVGDKWLKKKSEMGSIEVCLSDRPLSMLVARCLELKALCSVPSTKNK